MARQIHKLTARQVATLGAGKHGDGGGLVLIVSDTGARNWKLIYTIGGKRRAIGLGGAGAGGTSLAEARQKAADARKLVAAGIDPLADKAAGEAAEAQAKAKVLTFGQFALKLVDGIEGGFRNAKHRQQWRNTLQTYCQPLWAKPIGEVDTPGVLKCLNPIWQKKAETASRLRGRIERVIDAAKAQGLFVGPNPATWKGHLAATLPKPDKLARGHHAAMPYDDIAPFMARLRTTEGLSALALEFAILTASRSGEVLNMAWGEVDLAAKIWTVPAKRMKAGRDHRVPLSGRAMAVLERMNELRQGEFVFAGRRPNVPLSSGAFTMLLRRAGGGFTAHGFRSSFSDWASEVSNFSTETREACLAHTIKNKAEAAYRRGDQLEKRRVMLEAWAAWCEPMAAGDNVVMLHKV